MYVILITFSGVLGHFEAGTERSFTSATAQLLKEGGYITEVGSEKHKAWLEAQKPAAEPEPTETQPAAELETKPEPEVAVETKPAPAQKTSRKAK